MRACVGGLLGCDVLALPSPPPCSKLCPVVPALNQDVENAIVAQCKRHSLQPTANFVTKCLQLHETVRVRHGVMVVGQTMSGKTAVLRTLGRALTSISVETRLEEEGRQQAAAAAKEKEEAEKRRREEVHKSRHAPHNQRQRVRAMLRQNSGKPKWEGWC